MTEEVNEQEFLQYYTTIQRKSKEQRGLSGEMSGVKKRAKEAGVDLDVLGFATKLAKLTAVERIAKVNRLTQYLQFLRLPDAEQMSFLQQLDPTAAPTQTDYRAEGYKAYLDGDGGVPEQYDVTSVAYKHWVEGYDDAKANMQVEENVDLLTAGIKPLAEEPEEEIPDEVPDFIRPPAKRKLKVVKSEPEPVKEKPKPKRKPKAKMPEPEPEPMEDDGPPPEPEEEEEDLATRLLKRHRGE